MSGTSTTSTRPRNKTCTNPGAPRTKIPPSSRTKISRTRLSKTTDPSMTSHLRIAPHKISTRMRASTATPIFSSALQARLPPTQAFLIPMSSSSSISRSRRTGLSLKKNKEKPTKSLSKNHQSKRKSQTDHLTSSLYPSIKLLYFSINCFLKKKKLSFFPPLPIKLF